MAADDAHEFLPPENIGGGTTPAQTRDVDGGGRELAALNPHGAVARPAAEADDALSGRLPPFKLERFDGIANCGGRDVEAAKLVELCALVSVPPSSGAAERDALFLKAIDLYESLEPSDGIEGMLAVQMVGTHNASVECIKRAMVCGQSFEAQKAYLSHAERLMGMYLRHVDALARHRGGGRPNITVGQVNVESGGRAIVGNVGAGAGSAAPATSPPLIGGADAPPAVANLKRPTRGKARQ